MPTFTDPDTQDVYEPIPSPSSAPPDGRDLAAAAARTFPFPGFYHRTTPEGAVYLTQVKPTVPRPTVLHTLLSPAPEPEPEPEPEPFFSDDLTDTYDGPSISDAPPAEQPPAAEAPAAEAPAAEERTPTKRERTPAQKAAWERALAARDAKRAAQN